MAAGVAVRPDFAANGQSSSSLSGNSQRLSYVVERLSRVVDSTSQHSNSFIEINQLCLALARGIDYAVANNDVPFKVQELPILLKKVCQCKMEYVLEAIMVLMISVKVACKCQWFTDNDTVELLTLANEIGSSFSSQGDINSEPSVSLPTVLNVLARYCPQVKTGQIFASVEINPGYDAYLVDFRIPKNQNGSARDNIRLFVAHTDDVETSSCLISPPQVNFLLNGRAVVKRTNAGTSPQMPTDVTSMLKYGPNLLQAVGQFNGHYLVVIASMIITSMPETSTLPDYVPFAVTAEDADADLIEGPSRISLNCPISCKRIKTPAKGQSCKHLQSFDLNNFMNLNVKTLSWRCPHCGQSTSYQNIRIDQDMAKILREVGENVADVVINEDGSWKPGAESNGKNDGSDPQETTPCTDAISMICDLTEEDDEMDVNDSEDHKPFQANVRSQAMNTIIPSNQDSAIPNQGNFWAGLYLSTINQTRPDAMSDVQTVSHMSEMSPAEFGGSTTLLTQNQFTHLTALLHPSQAVNSTLSNEYGILPSRRGNINVTRVPTAIQALPAQSGHSVPEPRPRTSMSSLPPSNGSSPLPTTYGLNTTSNGFTGGRPHCSMPNTSPRQVPERASFHHRAASHLNTGQRDHLSIPTNHTVQGAAKHPAPTQLPGSYTTSPRIEQPNAAQQQYINQRVPQNIHYPLNSMTRTPPHLQRTHLPRGGSQSNMGNAGTSVSSNSHQFAVFRTGQLARHAPVQMQSARPATSTTANSMRFRSPAPVHLQHTPVQMQSARPSTHNTANSMGFRSPASVQPVTTTEDLMSPSQDWRPTGRMRGSLSGQRYSEVLSQFMTGPSQQNQDTRPLANQTSVPSPVPPHLQVLLANNRNVHASPNHDTQMKGAESMTSNLGVSPHQAL